MASVALPRSRKLTPESRFVLHDVGWKGYETLRDVIGDRPIRLTYDRGIVEFMRPSQDHEQVRRLLGRVVDILTEELFIPCICAGSTAWRREDLDRALEPDDCFYLANAKRVRGKKIDLRVDPPPDLAIEIEIGRTALDRMGIYAALGIPEVWRYDGESLRVDQLRDPGTYATVRTSSCFPFLPLEDIVRFLRQGESMDHGDWGRQFRRWVHDDLIPRMVEGQRDDDIQEEHP